MQRTLKTLTHTQQRATGQSQAGTPHTQVRGANRFRPRCRARSRQNICLSHTSGAPSAVGTSSPPVKKSSPASIVHKERFCFPAPGNSLRPDDNYLFAPGYLAPVRNAGLHEAKFHVLPYRETAGESCGTPRNCRNPSESTRDISRGGTRQPTRRSRGAQRRLHVFF